MHLVRRSDCADVLLQAQLPFPGLSQPVAWAMARTGPNKGSLMESEVKSTTRTSVLSGQGHNEHGKFVAILVYILLYILMSVGFGEIHENMSQNMQLGWRVTNSYKLCFPNAPPHQPYCQPLDPKKVGFRIVCGTMHIHHCGQPSARVDQRF